MTNTLVENLIYSVTNTYGKMVGDIFRHIALRSLDSLSNYKPEDFIEYGKYAMFDYAVRQVVNAYTKQEKIYPQLVLLYGPPGTGKTSWVRHAASKYLGKNGVYLEVSPGDTASMYAGVAVQVIRSVLYAAETAATRAPVILLFDEADGLLTRPSSASTDLTIERTMLISDFKSRITQLTGKNLYLVIALTTNFKNAIAETDPAVADRVTMWVEVTPPPLRVKEAMIMRRLQSILPEEWMLWKHNWWPMRSAGKQLDPSGIKLQDALKARTEFEKPFNYFMPILPFDAEYVAGYLTAWGWNPLDPDLRGLLGLQFKEVMRIWEKENPVFRIYTRGLLSQVEMYIAYLEKTHGVSTSFLRQFNSVKRAMHDLSRILEWYTNLYSRIKLKPDKYWLEDTFTGMLVHPLPPSLLHLLLAKYADMDFIVMVNNVLGTTALIANALRRLYLPFLFSALGDNTADALIDVWIRLGRHNLFIRDELEKGRLLEPVRMILREPDPEKAWRSAADSLAGIGDPDIRACVGVAVIGAYISHRALHARPEDKGRALADIYSNRRLADTLLDLARQLGIHEWLPALLTRSSVGGIMFSPVSKSGYELVDPSLFRNSILETNSYVIEATPAPMFREEPLENYVNKVKTMLGVPGPDPDW